MKYALAAFLVLVALLAFFAWKEREAPSAPTAPLPPQLEIADTAEERARGLSGRDALPDDYGLLFIFPEDVTPAFWMKDMRFPIDIVWIAADGRIAGVTAEVSPETYPETFGPPELVRYVLEMAAGEAARRGYATGTPLKLPK